MEIKNIHHFLFYIFRFDKERCKIESKKEEVLQEIVRKNLQHLQKEVDYGK